MYRVYLGLGSNLGDRLKYLNSALRELAKICSVKASSHVYSAQPYQMESEHEFLNAALKIETSLEPPELLHKLRQLEHKLGRSSPSHMKDREIDLDILLYENLYYEAHTGHAIEVPHPDLTNRKFALISLNDLGPEVVHPIEGETVAALLRRCTDKSEVKTTTMSLDSSQIL